MSRTSNSPKDETFTFRLDPALKAALNHLARDEQIQPAELMRDLLRDHLARREQRAFEDEARRQSLAVAARARDPKSDEARVIGEIEAGLDRDDFVDEWKA